MGGRGSRDPSCPAQAGHSRGTGLIHAPAVSWASTLACRVTQ